MDWEELHNLIPALQQVQNRFVITKSNALSVSPALIPFSKALLSWEVSVKVAA